MKQILIIVILAVFSQHGYCQNTSGTNPRKQSKNLLADQKLEAESNTNENTTSETENAKEAAELQRTASLIKKYGYTDGRRISEGKIWLGMSVNMALDSWGIPYRINRSMGNWGAREQWVFSNASLLFENGILTTVEKGK